MENFSGRRWTTLPAGGKSTYEIVHSQLQQKMINIMDWVAYQRDRFGHSSPSTAVCKVLVWLELFPPPE